MVGIQSAGGRGGHGDVEHVLSLPVGSGLPEGVDELVVRPSVRRRRTVSLKSEGGRLVMLVPAGLRRQDEVDLARTMLTKLQRRQHRLARAGSDEALLARALRLRARYLPAVPAPAQVRWADDQNSRWGSCTSVDATIRISTQLREMPDWVVDHVLLHELAHLLHPDHGPGFAELMAGCPRSERARGFLEGWSQARSTPPAPDRG